MRSVLRRLPPSTTTAPRTTPRQYPFIPITTPPSTRTTSSTSTTKPVRKHSRQTSSAKPALSLEHFLVRQRVVSLYRNIIRALHALPRDSAQRHELRDYARTEFERHRAVSDVGKIRYLVSTGKTELDGMRRYLGEMGGR
ncbi:uncharacterized protein HMPREF1541_06635 [Cyphellophora europaea CBS 101466]|uniref:LYR motif-containing protein 2 n=1 Tax=Cyphellophora europaea (strain CBS 101466) TaxID=1220924 RepID=W2RS80_CYPE1|nr:uncharacterized protein HMPREF1541_06635 [Cyphellophora europaea CBS 101466]ETN38598.1 hypothetical protein HMPREF1541_06635 [Cyphellophora europaea CBS 101466]